MSSSTQQSGVSGDGREGLRQQVLHILDAYRIENNECGLGMLDIEPSADRIMRLLDAQFNDGLEAAEAALPEKRILPSEHPKGIPLKNASEDYCIGFNNCIDTAHQQIRALRRGKAE